MIKHDHTNINGRASKDGYPNALETDDGRLNFSEKDLGRDRTLLRTRIAGTIAGRVFRSMALQAVAYRDYSKCYAISPPAECRILRF